MATTRASPPPPSPTPSGQHITEIVESDERLNSPVLSSSLASEKSNETSADFSSILKSAEDSEMSPHMLIIQKLPPTEENLEPDMTTGMLERILPATSKKSLGDANLSANQALDVEKTGSDTALIAPPEKEQRTLQVSTSVLESTPIVSAEDVSKLLLGGREVSSEKTAVVVKCSSHVDIERRPSDLRTKETSVTITETENSTEMSFDGTTEAKMASLHSSSERIQSNWILDADEVAANIPHVVIIHKAPSGAELTETGSSCSLGHAGLSATNVQKSESGTAVVSPPETTEERVAYVRTPSQNEISGEVSVVIVRSPRSSPRHSSGDISKRASPEQLQVPTSGLASTPTVDDSMTTGMLERMPPASKSSLDDANLSASEALDVEKTGSDTALGERTVYIRIPGQDEICAEVSAVRRLSPRHSNGDISERASTEQLQVSTSFLRSTPTVSTEDVSKLLLGGREVSSENTADVVKYSSDLNPCKMAASRESPCFTPSGQIISLREESAERVKSSVLSPKSSWTSERSNELPIDGTLELTSISTRPNSEGTEPPSMSKVAEESEVNSHVIIQKTHSIEELPNSSITSGVLESEPPAAPKSSKDGGSISSSNALDVQKSGSDTTNTAASPELAKEMIAFMRTPSQDEISAEIGASTEHLQVPTTGLMLIPTVSTEDISEPPLSVEKESSDKTPDEIKCSIENNFEKEEPCKIATIRAPLPPTPSGQRIAEIVKSVEPLLSPALSPKSSRISDESKDNKLNRKSVSSQLSSESIQFPSILKGAEESESIDHVVIIQKPACREELPESAMTSGVLERLPSKGSLDDINCSAIDALDVQKLRHYTDVVVPPESGELRIAFIKTPSQDEISAEVSVVRIRSPRLSPCHSSGDVSERASTEQLQVSTPTVSAEDISEPPLSVEEETLDKSSDVIKCLSQINMERKLSELTRKQASSTTISSENLNATTSDGVSASSLSSLGHEGLSVSDSLDVQKSGSDIAVVAPPESAEQIITYIRTPSQDEICTEVSVERTGSPRSSPRHSSGDDSERTSTEHLQVPSSGLASTPTVSAEDVSEDFVKTQVMFSANGIGSPELAPITFSTQGSSPVRDSSAILLKTKVHLKEAKLSCKEMQAQGTTKLLSQEKILSPGLSPTVSEIIGVWCDNLSEDKLDEMDESMEDLFLTGSRKACVSAESLELDTEADIDEVATVEELHQQPLSSKTDFVENLKNTVPAATTVSATAFIAPSSRIPSKDCVEVMPALSREKITSPRLSPRSSYAQQRSSPDGHQGICLSPKSSSFRGHSSERLESTRSLPKPSSVTELLSSVERAAQTSRSPLPIIDKATQMSRTSLLSISQASQTSRTLLPVAKQELRPSLPSVDQETQIFWTLPQGVDKRTQISRTSVTASTSSDQDSQMSSGNLHNQGTQMITPQGVPVTEKTVDTRTLICQSSSDGNWDNGKQIAQDISPGGFKEAEEKQKDKIWTLYHLGHKTDEGLLSTQVLSEPPFNGEAYIRNFGTGAVLLSERRKERLKPLSPPIRGRLVSASAFKSGQRPSSLGPSEMIIRPPHPPSRSSSTLPDYVFVVDTGTVNQDNFFNAPGTSQVQTNPLAWMSSQY
ncbi:mucin-3B-like [Sardina pilchardus]|uniref:mucin-3B-like n=1 Tax=Sardina pilchardus TaxID=27697 RepID=UPI002E14DAA6